MVERRRQAGLSEKALPEATVLGQLGREQLQRHLAPETPVLGEIDDAHAASAEQSLDPVAGQLGADTWIRPQGQGRLLVM
jgi:hypothetical protein